MRVTTEDLGVGTVFTIETEFRGLPVYVSIAPAHKHAEEDITGSASVMVGYLGKRVRWPNGRETEAHVYERIWAPTWDTITAAVQRCHDELVAMRDG